VDRIGDLREGGSRALAENVHGILVPGGFGERGAEGKIAAAKFARNARFPISASASACRWRCSRRPAIWPASTDANVDRVRRHEGAGRRPDDRMARGQQLKTQEDGDLGGTMRLGAYPRSAQARVADRGIYGATEISERHRHRYEVNIAYREQLEAAGLCSPARRRTGCCLKPSRSRPSLVHRRAIPSGAQVAAVRAASAVRLVHRGGG
jgi:CTP synthase (UTP-ammonia lyase)